MRELWKHATPCPESAYYRLYGEARDRHTKLIGVIAELTDAKQRDEALIRRLQRDVARLQRKNTRLRIQLSTLDGHQRSDVARLRLLVMSFAALAFSACVVAAWGWAR